jgi:hypothetical protein
MKKQIHYVQDSLIGNYYPFYLNNANLGEEFYLYQITTPCLGEKCVPLISLEKAGERTLGKHYCADEATWNMNHNDLFAHLFRTRYKISRRSAEYVANLLRKDHPVVYENGIGCPAVELDNDNNIQRAIIVHLRDEYRWKFYKFQAGRKIDVLWKKDSFMVFDIEGDEKEDSIWLTPRNMYRTNDPAMKNPIPFDPDTLQYPKNKFIGKTKASELNRILKRMEWQAFGGGHHEFR